MSANIYDERMFTVREAWHNIGKRVPLEVTAKEAIELANLNYGIVKTPLYVNINGEFIKTEQYGNLNTENNKVLGVVKDRYKIIQNVEAFDFFDNVVKSKEAFYHSAGALGDGERIWILAKLPSNMLIFNDVVEKYLLLTNSHDGKGSLFMYFTPVRVVCQNTLNQSLSQKDNGIAIRHTGNIQSKTEEAQKALGLALDFYTNLEANFKKFFERELRESEVETYFNNVLEIDTSKEVSTNKNNMREALKTLYVRGQGNEGKTLWHGYNAVTEFVDHVKTVKGERAKSILFGSGAMLKEKAYTEAVALVK